MNRERGRGMTAKSRGSLGSSDHHGLAGVRPDPRDLARVSRVRAVRHRPPVPAVPALAPLKIVSPALFFALRIALQALFFSWAAVDFYRAPRISGVARGLGLTVACYLLVVVAILLIDLPTLARLASER
jgi:hypothetical protein